MKKCRTRGGVEDVGRDRRCVKCEDSRARQDRADEMAEKRDRISCSGQQRQVAMNVG